MIKLLHVITALNTGGAENMLYKLLSGLDRTRFQAQVISLTDVGPIGERIGELGVPVCPLSMRRGASAPWAVIRLARWLRQARPDVIQTWLYHADLVGGLASSLAGHVPLAWNIRCSTLDPRLTKRRTLWTVAACARLSRWLPDRIVCAAEKARDEHARMGFDASKMLVIPNGFDVDRFQPDPEQRRSLRQELRITDDVPLVGMVARFDPQKDHANFLRAAVLLRARLPDVRFLLCGDDITAQNEQLRGWIRAAGLAENVYLLGRREDIARINNGLNIATLSSCGEAFPNVLGEAMCCAVPCVATDVGDTRLLLGESGLVVPPGDAQALAHAWQMLLEAGAGERKEIGLSARRRIIENYSLPVIVARYEALYEEMAAASGRN